MRRLRGLFRGRRFSGGGGTVVASPAPPADVTAPAITGFSVTSPNDSLQPTTAVLTASDAVGVTGYLITKSATPPAAGDPSWEASTPPSIPALAAYEVAENYYGHVKDAAGNRTTSGPVSVTAQDTVAPVASDVTISGTVAEDQLLTGSYTYTDAADAVEGTSTFRWLADDVAIAGATAITFTPTDAQVGAQLKFEVIPVAQTGASPGAAVQSPATTAVTAVNDASSGTLELSDTTPTTGTAVNLLIGTFADPDGVAIGNFTTIAWEEDNAGAETVWTPIAGATTASYTPVVGNEGNKLRVVASGLDDQGFAIASTTAATSVVAAAGAWAAFYHEDMSAWTSPMGPGGPAEFAQEMVVTYRNDSTWEGAGASYLRCLINAGFTAEAAGCLWFNIYSALAGMDRTDHYVGFIVRYGSNWFPTFTAQHKEMVPYVSSDSGASHNHGVTPMHAPIDTLPLGTKTGAQLSSAPNSSNWTTESGLVTHPADSDPLVWDALPRVGEWIYFELHHDCGNVATISVYTRDGVIAARDLITVPSLAAATDELRDFTYLLNYGFFDGNQDANSYTDISDFYVNDSFMGPPPGFVL